ASTPFQRAQEDRQRGDGRERQDGEEGRGVERSFPEALGLREHGLETPGGEERQRERGPEQQLFGEAEEAARDGGERTAPHAAQPGEQQPGGGEDRPAAAGADRGRRERERDDADVEREDERQLRHQPTAPVAQRPEVADAAEREREDELDEPDRSERVERRLARRHTVRTAEGVGEDAQRRDRLRQRDEEAERADRRRRQEPAPPAVPLDGDEEERDEAERREQRLAAQERQAAGD